MIEVSDKHTTTEPAPTGEAGMIPRTPKLRRRPLLVALAVVLTMAGAVGGSLLWSAATSAGEVVVVRQDVARGELITAADVGTIRVAFDPTLETIPAGELASLVGKRAVADLTAGTLLGRRAVGDTVVPGGGESMVGIPIAPGLMPAEPLQAGDTVRLVAAADTPAAAAPAPIAAKVLRVTPGDTQSVVDVVVPVGQATVWLVGWGSGKIVLVLESRAR